MDFSQECQGGRFQSNLRPYLVLQGQGIFAKRKIMKGTFIQEYLGELYAPWRWYEKQDLLRKNNPKETLPDFYNISLERPKQLPGGADVAFVEVHNRTFSLQHQF